MKLKRQTRFAKIGTKITVNIGQNEKVLLKNGQTATIPLDKGREEIYIRQWRSRRIKVCDQDFYLIVDNPLNVILFWSSIALILISHLLLSFDSDFLWWFTLIGILLLAVSYLTPRCHFKKAKEN
ncbi:hypothetical protein [Streptococcus porcinus]|uniref:Membrane protein n=2 Tax=Streptococcus porcinus TaxID=1340 RepID=A0A4V0H6B2_STRPO|nr:hypothetical protein [Streptococcus porcinus]EGJ27295.1 hypothetical protein STRPO_0666 [Streptococcus porcinus str. Jelinkova 176]SQG44641.1 membrane protein [Streptococcus porcinus]VTT44754.1 membrane protein [Streptococcus porcinus]VTT46163.1 membrane protein [Streptococcus porcinus]